MRSWVWKENISGAQEPAFGRKICLEAQMRRAPISITNDIAEGHGRWHYQENIQFCRIARGSVEEVIDDLNICTDEAYCQQINLEELKAEAYEFIKRINGYIAYPEKEATR